MSKILRYQKKKYSEQFYMNILVLYRCVLGNIKTLGLDNLHWESVGIVNDKKKRGQR